MPEAVPCDIGVRGEGVSWRLGGVNVVKCIGECLVELGGCKWDDGLAHEGMMADFLINMCEHLCQLGGLGGVVGV